VNTGGEEKIDNVGCTTGLCGGFAVIVVKVQVEFING